MRNIEDWCISRQIWWGHRIPAWYDDEGNVYVGRTETEVREKHGFDADYALRQDEDVLDTWFSSALWPFSTLGWPDNTQELKTYYPTSVLVTGFDIIFFWVARMIMMGLKFMGDVPFREVYIHGLVRDAEGQKMSKSKGNVLDPIDIIDGIDLESLVKKRTSAMQVPREAERVEKMTRKQMPEGIPAYGTDALRFTFAALASTGRDIKLDMNRIEGYRNYCNKLWNAARYVLMQCEGQDTGLDSDDIALSLADRWIISRLQQVEAEAAEHIEHYRFDLMAKALYEFTWHEYCDWYLELSKPILFDDERAANEKRGTRRTLVRVLEALLRLQHPLMPFITEEIWQSIAPLAGISGEQAATIMRRPYPEADPTKIDARAVSELGWLQEFVVGVRRIRSEMDIKPGKALPVFLQNWTEADRSNFANNEGFITSLAKLESVTWLQVSDTAPESATALAGEMKILIPLAGLIDKDAELARLDKEIAKIEKNLEKTEAKLGNSNFVDRAPEHVVQVEKDRAEEMLTALAQLREQHEKIQNM
jgi:valyl-tRNA synthetase